MRVSAREKILAAADELFTRRGYGNVGINEIIERSGTAKASFYQYFPGKDTLCLAWLNQWHERTEMECERILSGPGGGEAKILRVFDELKAFLEEGDYRGCPFTNTTGFLGANSDPKIRELIVHHKQYQRNFMVTLARELTTPAKAEKLGSGLFLLYAGATMEGQNHRDTWPVDAARHTARQLIRTTRAGGAKAPALAAG
jgi:AcrR family transcriptional regulator